MKVQHPGITAKTDLVPVEAGLGALVLLGNRVPDLAAALFEFQTYDGYLKAKREQFDRENAEIITQRQAAQDVIAALDPEVRALAVRAYEESGRSERVITDGIEIDFNVKAIYEPEALKEAACKRGMLGLLTLDVKAVNQLAMSLIDNPALQDMLPNLPLRAERVPEAEISRKKLIAADLTRRAESGR